MISRLHISIIALIVALLSVLTSCSAFNEPEHPCPEPETGSGNILLSFNMISSNIGASRSDDKNHDEIDSEWRQFEDLIDVRNFAFYIFLDNDVDGKKPLVMKMTNIAGSTDPNQMITGGNGIYTVTTIIPKQNLEDLLGKALDPDPDKNVQFRIVLLANAPAGTDYNALANTGTPFADFMTNAGNLHFNENSIYSPLTTDGTVDGIYKGAIPMFGMMTFSASQYDLYYSRPEERINAGEVFMLRSLAKIRVINNFTQNEEGYPKVTSVIVRGNTNMSAQLPANATTYQNGTQVHTTNISTTTADANKDYRLGYLTSPDVHFGYIPEQSINYLMPEIEITAQLDADITRTFRVPMTGNDEYSLNFGTDILRNHIYTLEINSIFAGILTITAEVADWDDSVFNFDYSDDISTTTEGAIDWKSGFEGTPSVNDDDKEGTVIISPWQSSTQPTILVGTFGLATPKGAKWMASLILEEGEGDAFYFCDSQGNEIQTMEGIINDKALTLSTLRIATRYQTPAQNNKVRLQIVVETGNGFTVATGSKLIRWHIVQNSQL